MRLAYSAAEPTIVQVAGEGGHTGQMWKIARSEKVLLKASGGSGGAGGRGENGQAGGYGRQGRDATKYSRGEDGGDGGRGGECVPHPWSLVAWRLLTGILVAATDRMVRMVPQVAMSLSLSMTTTPIFLCRWSTTSREARAARVACTGSREMVVGVEEAVMDTFGTIHGLARLGNAGNAMC